MNLLPTLSEESLMRKALSAQGAGAFPVWLMRQAGRALKSYRRLREEAPFLKLCKEPELVARATLLPVRELGVDAAILFHDILLALEGWGITIAYEGSPRLSFTIETEEELERLPELPGDRHLRYLEEGIAATLAELPPRVPLIGFIPGPWTLLYYLLNEDPARFEILYTRSRGSLARAMEKLLRLLELHAQVQIRAGVHLLQIFDTWIEALSPERFQGFFLPYLRTLLSSLGGELPILYYGKGTARHLQALATLPVTGISCDGTLSLPEVRRSIPLPRVLQGNFPPELLKGSPREIRTGVRRMLLPMREDPAYIVNLAHGVLPDTPEENLKLFIEAVHEHRL